MASSPVLTATARPVAAGDMVLIGCKHPTGLILNLDSYKRIGEGNIVQRIHGKASVMLRGWARKIGQPDDTEGGYAMTAVPADFWEQWFRSHKDSSLLVDKIILPPASDGAAQARDHAEVPAMFAPAKFKDVPGIELGTRTDRVGT